MRVLLDTHILLWALAAPAKLPREARDVVEDRANEILFSAASIWEIAIKAPLLRADFGVDANEIAAAARDTDFVELPISSTHAAGVAAVAPHHKDPFDRLLVSQALAEPARLLTADVAIAAYSRDLVWLVG
jgi:PIN domain nuclease of toxin-antitoxin system